MFRSGFNGGIVFSDDCRPAGYPRDVLGKAVAEGKRIRKYYFGDFYPLVPVTAGAGDWCVLQYHLPAEEEGMILAFRRHESPAAEMELSVRSIDPEGEYDVTLARGFERPPPVRLSGRKTAAAAGGDQRPPRFTPRRVPPHPQQEQEIGRDPRTRATLRPLSRP